MTDSGSACAACGSTYRDVLAICPQCQTPIDSGLPSVGEIFDSKYEIMERLGAGGMGEVFKARHVHLGSLRAIKVMRKSLAVDEISRRRFNREARLATHVHHPHVAIVYDFAVAASGSSYIVSELVEGITLRQWSAAADLFSEVAALEIAIQTLSGLQHLHAAGIIHRDVSSDNIMVTRDARGAVQAKIIDLGLAKLLADTPVAEGTTRAGLFLGNPRYSSPEQLGALPDGEEIDARSDVYSFGVVLYELLTGAPPFASSTPQGYAAKHLTEHPPALTPRPGKRFIAEELQTIVRKALEKQRLNRYQSAQELAEALSAFARLRREDAGRTRETPLPESPPVKTETGFVADTAVEAWAHIEYSSDREALRAFLTAYPEHRAATIVRDRLRRIASGAAIYQATAELQAWNDAVHAGNERGWLRFLESYPLSQRRQEAMSMLDETRDYERAISAGSEAALRSYLQTWPDGFHRAEAGARLNGWQQARPSTAVIHDAPDLSLAGEIVAALREQWLFFVLGLVAVAIVLYFVLS